MRKVLIIDTSVLCVWLQVPGMLDCGPLRDKWTHERIVEKIEASRAEGALLVLPLATIIETGNHITRHANCYNTALKLSDKIRECANGDSPWAAFVEQSELWTTERLILLADGWPDLAARAISIGDATIKDVASYYLDMGRHVEILTGDQGLQEESPEIRTQPRRRAAR
ncbi:hypothetical protein [Aeromonas popoffii]|uniref:hypothetical protein n=1 Tax=Aeromonas popoffii TaxID=70856 RepID=UPI0030CBA1F3